MLPPPTAVTKAMMKTPKHVLSVLSMATITPEMAKAIFLKYQWQIKHTLVIVGC